MTTSKSPRYLMGRDYLSSMRLSMQSMLWRKTWGWSLHPSLPPPTSATSIADIAIANGHWLIDVLQDSPNVGRATGFDISFAQLAPPASWPANTTLTHWDVYEDPPAEAIGAFDIVHARGISVLFVYHDPAPIFARIHKLLKPGGWFQWDEYDFPGAHVAAPSTDTPGTATAAPAASFPKQAALAHLLTHPPNDGNFAFWPAAPSILGQIGFTEIAYEDSLDTYLSSAPLLKLWNDQHSHIAMGAELNSVVFARDAAAQAANAKILDEAYDEARETGAAVVLRPCAWIARKPL